MSFNDREFAFSNYNFAVDTSWNEGISHNEFPFVPPKGNMIFLNNANMEYLSGDRMKYLET